MMDKEKLLQVLASLMDKQPELKHDIMTYIPAPTIPSALAVLTDLENKLHASFPYNKNGPQRDQYTFSRVRESLLELIDAITQYSHYFVSGNVFPTTTFTYLDQVTYFVHRLPVWDMDQHNQHRLDLYKDMALFWKQAIQTASAQSSPIISTFNADTINLWATHLAHHNTLANGMLGDVILEFNQCFLSTSIPPPACHSSPSSPAWIPSPIIGYTDL
ncbi:Cut8 six-helix bundle-domain-containing protein [Chlamydoabsidia padenii]|nr:Cut8 six-helix bundle-domain-containing protein [Chlamydoabsidia padenii]